MTFKEFLHEATATANPEKAKAELEKIGKELAKFFKDNYGENFRNTDNEGYSVTEYSKGKVVMLELNATLLNQGHKTPILLKHTKGVTTYATGRHRVHNTGDIEGINSVLKEAMKEAKKVIKDNGLEQNKDLMYPGSSAKAVAKGTTVEVSFWIGFDKV